MSNTSNSQKQENTTYRPLSYDRWTEPKDGFEAEIRRKYGDKWGDFYCRLRDAPDSREACKAEIAKLHPKTTADTIKAKRAQSQQEHNEALEQTRQALGAQAELLKGNHALGTKDLPDRAKPLDEDPIPF